MVPDYDAVDIEHDIEVLHDLAKRLRQHRLDNGCLTFDLPRLSFKLDDNGKPEDCDRNEHTDAEDLIQEV